MSTITELIETIDTSVYWWSVVMRKNMPGMPKPNPVGGEHLYVAAIGRHDAKSRDALASGTGMTPEGAIEMALGLLDAAERAGDDKAEDVGTANRSKKKRTRRGSRAHPRHQRAGL